MFAIGAAAVVAAFFASNGVSGSTIILVVATAAVMVPITGGIVAVGEFLRRRQLSRFDAQR